MPLIAKYRRARAIIQRGIRANQPLATDVLEGTIYFVSDELATERSDGTIWESITDAGSGLHAASHENGGADEIDLTGLSGLLATAQIPILHAASHENGGSDEIDITALDGYVSPFFIEQTTTATGTQNNLSLSARRTYLRCNNASALVITGFTIGGVAPQAGDQVYIDNVGTSTVKVTNENTGSTAAYRSVTASVNGQIVGANGRLLGVYDDTTDRWRITCINAGEPINFPHGSLTFAAVGGSWTVGDFASGDFDYVKMVQDGKRVTYWVGIYNTDVGATSTGLDISEGGFPPGGFTNPGVGVQVAPCQCSDAGTVGLAFMLFRDDALRFQKADATAWTATTADNTFVRGSTTVYVD